MTVDAGAVTPIPDTKPETVEATSSDGARPGAELAAGIPVPVKKRAVPEGYDAPQANLVLRSDRPAKDYFGAADGPAPLKARAIGSYAKGCLAGGSVLPPDGPTWQAMRLSRNRNWGHPALIDYLKDLAADAPKAGWNGLLVGDLAQPRGGPMTSGHASHQIGLDADIWLTEMPNRRLTPEEREEISAISMLKGPLDVKGADRRVDPAKWTDTHARLIRHAASDNRVARIFVSPTIKKALCEFETGRDREWLRKVRPWWGHHYHFHVRLSCPPGSTGCKDQNPPPPGDGCGAHLTYWLSDEPWVPKEPRKPGEKPKVVKKRPMALAALPQDCRTVLTAN
ncbi:penicillin-insensitive murein endopeptidase [Roseibium salinum]|uniref:Penicillin-insensitive murein endopeptidase n=1 Tax=Roseibium salinum TaxID=1604349 RepID=A0ABT3R4Y7_9HYPH|nr:penicillin-insensitive murein endopeptidase [Roseibium sp. DSM 29163]MCX2724195.1 penicillin-insensitive murein endopeptidase [Roseibium sp. DSM 29163]